MPIKARSKKTSSKTNKSTSRKTTRTSSTSKLKVKTRSKKTSSKTTTSVKTKKTFEFNAKNIHTPLSEPKYISLKSHNDFKLFAGSALDSMFCSFYAIFALAQWSLQLRLVLNDPSKAAAFGHRKPAYAPEHGV